MVTKKKQIETNSELLNIIKVFCEKAKKNELITINIVDMIEGFLYGNIVKNILKNLLDENNKESLYEEFSIAEEEISKVRLYPSLIEFTKDENPKGTLEEYLKFKEILSTVISPKMNNFILDFEGTVLLENCEKELNELKKLCTTEETLAKNVKDSLKVGIIGKDDNFSELTDSKFNYFNKYSNEQLDEIYEASPHNREIIDKVRKYRKKLEQS